MVRQSDVTKVFGWLLTVLGVVGFVPNPLVGPPEDAVFGVNLLHTFVHLLTGLVALGVVYMSPTPERHSKAYNVTFGAVYALVAVVGFVLLDTMRDLLAVNHPDNALHVLFAVVLLGVGLTVDVPPEDTATP